MNLNFKINRWVVITGKAVAGEYTVKEPDGNIRTVKYHADEDGFHATVHNSRGNDHHGGADASYDDER